MMLTTTLMAEIITKISDYRLFLNHLNFLTVRRGNLVSPSFQPSDANFRRIRTSPTLQRGPWKPVARVWLI